MCESVHVGSMTESVGRECASEKVGGAHVWGCMCKCGKGERVWSAVGVVKYG